MKLRGWIEGSLVVACAVTLMFVAKTVLAANGGSTCPETITTPNSNPTLSCPGGTCWGAGTECVITGRGGTTPVPEWAWNADLHKWVKTGATFDPQDPNVGVHTCVCKRNEPLGHVGDECCRIGFVLDGAGQKRIITYGDCAETTGEDEDCPPGECTPVQYSPDPENPDAMIVPDCT